MGEVIWQVNLWCCCTINRSSVSFLFDFYYRSTWSETHCPLIIRSDRVLCVVGGMDPKGGRDDWEQKVKGRREKWRQWLVVCLLTLWLFVSESRGLSLRVMRSRSFQRYLGDSKQFILYGVPQATIVWGLVVGSLEEQIYFLALACCQLVSRSSMGPSRYAALTPFWKLPYLVDFNSFRLICNRKQCIAMDESLVLRLTPDDTWNEKKMKEKTLPKHIAYICTMSVCIQVFRTRNLI